jgi:Putative peptidoglycan binding domain
VLKAIFPALALFAVASSLAATPAAPHKRRHPVKAASSTSAPTRPAVASKTTARRKGKVVHTAVRSFQQAPTPDRYKEIQQALANKGYFKAEPNGEWGLDSADALKRFQADQNLMPDGKINSLSLIALGLGPKRLTAKSDPAPQAGAPVPAPSNPPQ